MPTTSTKPSALTLASSTASMSSSFLRSGFEVEPELGAPSPSSSATVFGSRSALVIDGCSGAVSARPAATAAAALAGTCAHEFLTFSQSARNDSRPRSVSGCFTRFFSTANGTVAMSAPMSAACTTWFALRIDAAMTSTSWPKS